MVWTATADRATGYLVPASLWNEMLGASGNLEELRVHTHDGTDGDGSTSLGPLVLGDFTDAAAPAAPGAGKTRIYSVAGVPSRRAGAAGVTRAIANDADLDLADVTTNDVSTAKHGLVPKAPNDTGQFLRGDGAWATANLQEVGYAAVDTDESTTSTTYTDLATAGPSVTMTAALNDKMTFTLSARQRDDTVGDITFAAAKLDAVATAEADGTTLRQAVGSYNTAAAATGQFASLSAASHTVKVQYKVTGSGTGNFAHRHLSVVRSV